ncbi:MAG: hypothetical protein LOX98_10380 [Lysobacter sp.]|nr:hypothetical protein [Lysobacter sp.]
MSTIASPLSGRSSGGGSLTASAWVWTERIIAKCSRKRVIGQCGWLAAMGTKPAETNSSAATATASPTTASRASD